MLGQRAMRRLSTWRAGASTLEEVSFLPILNIMKGLPVVHTVAPSASTFRAVVDMVKYRTGSLMVMKDDQMAGIITERDILDKLSLDVVGESRAKAVEALMTPADSLSTAPPNYTLDKCVKQMKSGVFRHLPIIENGEVKACISLRDIAQQVSSGLSKKPMTSPPTVAELMDAKGSGGCIELPASSMVADAVKLMQQTKAGSVLVSSGASSFGLFTERDFLTKVAVYDEVAPSALPISLVSTPSDVVKCVAPTARVTDCLSIMLAGGFRHLPVIDNKQPVGMISMRDILNFFLAPK